MSYRTNKIAAIFHNTEPTMTDQAGAADTDINIIVKRHATTGTMPGAATQPIFGDFSELPDNLRDAIEMSRKADHLRATLPKEFKNLSIEELQKLTMADINAMLKPADKPANDKKDEPT